MDTVFDDPQAGQLKLNSPVLSMGLNFVLHAKHTQSGTDTNITVYNIERNYSFMVYINIVINKLQKNPSFIIVIVVIILIIFVSR